MKKLLVAGCWLLVLFPLSVFAREKPKVVASFNIIGDMARQVGGDNIELTTLVGANGDAHEYEPTPTDAKTLAAADIVLVNGHGFEGWMERLVKSSGYKGKVVVVSNGITIIPDDPHAWQDLSNGKIYAENIKNALVEADRNHMEEYSKNAVVYIKELSELDGWVKSEFAKIPAEKRRVISTHDAFQYFAKAYDIQFIAAQGVSTEAQASAADIARLIDQIRANKVTAVFFENMTDSRLMKQLQKDAGAHIGGVLYSDSLSAAGEPAPTYIDMFRHNVGELVKAMAYEKNDISENDKSVLALLKKSKKPITAYDILDKLKGSSIKAPQTVYRSLEALSERGLIHRIQSLGAFVACHNDEDDHGTQFAVCRECKTVVELHDHRICKAAQEIGSKINFKIEREMLELIGLCEDCSKKSA